jgi:hypothetical protein
MDIKSWIPFQRHESFSLLQVLKKIGRRENYQIWESLCYLDFGIRKQR